MGAAPVEFGVLLVMVALLAKSDLFKNGAPTTTTTTRGVGEYPPRNETGHMTFAAWQLKFGGSPLDYEDWLKGV